jgi:hypothetical protein
MSGIRLPEVHIPLPEAVMQLVDILQFAATSAHTWLLDAVEKLTISPEFYEQLRANALLLFGVSIIFWPLVLSIITSLTFFGAWIFWLFTTSIFGILQLIYVIYMFFMIALDILLLSILKTYTMGRTKALYYLGKSGTWDKSRSRRIVWRERLEAADTYEDFLKIQIEAREPEMQKLQRRKSDPAMMRSNSFANVEKAESPTKHMSRNRSFSTLVTAASEEGPEQVPLDPVVVDELGEMSAVMLMTTKQRLKEARQNAMKHEDDMSALSTLKQLLTGVVKRNHLNTDNFLITNARSVASSGQYGLSAESRRLIQSYYEEAEKGLDWVADSPIPEETNPNNKFEERILEENEDADGIDNSHQFAILRERTLELNDRITLIRKIRANVGRTSLMLSGGGAQAMYHLGTIRALIESNVYQDIKVISGTSGGSISAAMCALKTPEELYRDVCVPTVSTDYLLTGEQAKQNIRWFPTVCKKSRKSPSLQGGRNWMQNLIGRCFFVSVLFCNFRSLIWPDIG